MQSNTGHGWTRIHAHENGRLHILARGETRSPGPLKTKAAELARDIHHFADEVQAWTVDASQTGFVNTAPLTRILAAFRGGRAANESSSKPANTSPESRSFQAFPAACGR